MTAGGTASLEGWAFVAELCRAAGFARAGLCAAAPTSHREFLLRWLAEERHGEMRYLERRVELRIDPRAMVPDAKAILCVADRYSDGRRDAVGQPLRGRIGRYARGGDYHAAIRARLEAIRDRCLGRWPQHRFRVCVDTAPLLEREHAARAGLGAIGKHTLLIEPGVGSWLLLGAIVSTMPAESDTRRAGEGRGAIGREGRGSGSAAAQVAGPEPSASLLEEHAGGRGAAASSGQDPCGTCTRCIDACPTGCIEPFAVDAARCISYLTLEHRGAVDERLHSAIGDWIAGCDVCQEVCPHSAATRRSRSAPIHAAYAPRRDSLDVMEVIGWKEHDRRAVVEDSPLGRLSLPMFRRNAIIVAGNTVPPALRPALCERLRRIAEDAEEDGVVRATARSVLRRLSIDAAAP
ncbi:MAG TPA: DUF1730 domain-containing protein [Phycisphaerales bacterium]|nr:DUF1730 domain-containing protein [Phycisphaerales bacterium]HMP36477.1 DUF1730 domain-containing protein [Phycisphaerales bacterium]